MTPDQENIVTGLDSFIQGGFSTNSKEYSFLNNNNMGNRTLLISIPLHEFYNKSEVANDRNIKEIPALDGQAVAQRNLDLTHARNIAKYLLRGLFYACKSEYHRMGEELPADFATMLVAVGEAPYLSTPPMIVNVRECKAGGADLRFDSSKNTVFFDQRHKFWVVDGQHRRQGVHLVLEYLRKLIQNRSYPKTNQLYDGKDKGDPVTANELIIWEKILDIGGSAFSISMEVHLGLNPDEERQLFHDTNSYGKKVSPSLASSYDSSNAINNFIKSELQGAGLLRPRVVEKDIVNWNQDTGVIARKDLNAVCAILFLKKTNIKGASSNLVSQRTDTAKKFFGLLNSLPHFGEDKAKLNTVLAQPVVLKALASLVYEFQFSRKPDNQAYRILLRHVHDFDFSHTNPIFRCLAMSPEEREIQFPGISKYLPPEVPGVNRDIGNFDGTYMRFGAKHNDIYPLLGDLIRYTLKLPARKHRVRKSK